MGFETELFLGLLTSGSTLQNIKHEFVGDSADSSVGAGEEEGIYGRVQIDAR